MQEIATNTESSRAERPSRRSRRTRRELVDAALAILEEGGIGGLTVKAVTDRAEMGHGTFYHHFASTEDVLAAAVETSLRERAEELWLHHSESDDKAWVIAHSVVASVRTLAVHPAIEPMMQRPALLADALGRAVGEFAATDLDALLATGEVRRSQAERMVPYWPWLIIGALSIRLADPSAASRLDEDLIDLTLRTLGIPEVRITEMLGRLAVEQQGKREDGNE